MRHLIVDLRGNEGGLDVGHALLARMVAAPLRVRDMPRFTRYRAVPEALRRHLRTWDPSFLDWGGAAQPAEHGFFRLTRYDDDEAGADVITPVGKRFAGRLVVLIDASNSSATGQFAQIVKEQGLGTLVGEPTGGNRRGINGGAFFFATLPGSGIEVDVPLIARFPDPDHLPDGVALPFASFPDAGVEPDVRVAVTAADLAHGTDSVLRTALASCGGR